MPAQKVLKWLESLQNYFIDGVDESNDYVVKGSLLSSPRICLPIVPTGSPSRGGMLRFMS